MTTIEIERQTRSSHIPWSPSRVIYAVAGFLVVWFSFVEYWNSTASACIRTRDVARLTTSAYHFALAAPFVYISALGLALWFFRPVHNLFNWDKEVGGLKWRSVYKHLLLGFFVGSLVSLVTAPIPIRRGQISLEAVATSLSGSNSAYFLFPIWILLAAAIAICMELFFGGILFRSLAEYASVPASIIASCLLGAYLWPVGSPFAGVIFGAVSAILFYKSRFLLASIVAATVFLCAGPLCSQVFHHFMK